MGNKSKGIYASNRTLVILICILSVTLVALLILGASLGRNTPGGDDPQLGGTTPSDLITDAPTDPPTDPPTEAPTEELSVCSSGFDSSSVSRPKATRPVWWS